MRTGVAVQSYGFGYNERQYKSLSAIAKEITVTKWNGYLFFHCPPGMGTAMKNCNGRMATNGARAGRLIVNACEAPRVRTIFDLYLEHQAALPVIEALRRYWHTKRWE